MTEQRLAEIEARAKAVADYPTIVLAASEIDRAFLLATLRAAEAREARLREALEELDQWSQAYPLKVFPEPDFAEVRKLLAAGGITVDAVSASNMRHVITRVGEIARAALEQKS